MQRLEVLVTGASGFFGGVLKRRLLAEGFAVTNIDLVKDEDAGAEGLTSIQGDIRDAGLLARTFAEHRFVAVMHCAAMLAHDVKDETAVVDQQCGWDADGGRGSGDTGVLKFVFISTNCLWAEGFGRPVTEEDVPAPVELYGRSKLQAERGAGGAAGEASGAAGGDAALSHDYRRAGGWGCWRFCSSLSRTGRRFGW